MLHMPGAESLPVRAISCKVISCFQKSRQNENLRLTHLSHIFEQSFFYSKFFTTFKKSKHALAF